jgi:hypothetical protein
MMMIAAAKNLKKAKRKSTKTKKEEELEGRLYYPR